MSDRIAIAPGPAAEETSLLINRAETCSRLAAMASDIEVSERLLHMAYQYLSEAEKVMQSRNGTLQLGTTSVH
jgi:hypothetical protein